MWSENKCQHQSTVLNEDTPGVRRPMNRLIHTIRHFPYTRSCLRSNSLSNLVDELESFCPHGLQNSVEITQSSSTRRGFSKKYLNLRLYPTYGKSQNCVSKTLNHTQSAEFGPITNNINRCSMKKIGGLKRNCNILSNENQEKSFNKSDSRYSRQNKMSSKSDQLHNSKSKSNDQIKPHSLVQNNIHKKETPSFNVEKNIVTYKGCRPKEKSASKTKPRGISIVPLNDENKDLVSKCFKNNKIGKNCSKSELVSNKSLQSIIINDKQLSEDHSSIVKNLTNYWNNILDSELEGQHLDSGDSDTHGCRVSKSLQLLNKETSQGLDKNDGCLKNQNSSHSIPISETNKSENLLSVNCKSELEVNSETAVKVLQSIIDELKLYPNCCLQSGKISLSGGIKALVCLMVVSSLTEKEGITVAESSYTSQGSENNSNNKLCLKLPTVANNDRSNHCQTMERNTSKILTIPDVNLEKVKKALKCLMLLKEHLWMQFIFSKSGLPASGGRAKKPSSHNFTVICEEEIIFDSQEVSSDEDDSNGVDFKFLNQSEEALVNIAIAVGELITSVFDQIVLHKESIEYIVKTTYQILVSLLIWRIIIMDMIKK